MGKIMLIGLLMTFAVMMIAKAEFVFPSEIEDSSDEGIDNESVNDKERMLCNAIVRVTHDLYNYQNKAANEVNIYLDEDCKKLSDENLVEQCHEIVTEYGAKIYEHVKNGTGIADICQKIDDYSEVDLDNDAVDGENFECSKESKDKCRCCRIHVERRKMRLRRIIKRIARKRLFMCKHSRRPHLCRYWIRQRERYYLKKVARICPHAVCKHLGYCERVFTNSGINGILQQSKIEHTDDSSSLLLEIVLDIQLDTYFIKNICSEYEQFQTICVHLAASVDSRRYTKTYMAMLQNDTTWIEKDLRKEIQSIKIDTTKNQCDVCQNTTQIATKFYTNNLETVFKTLSDTCGSHLSKDKCQDMYNQQFNTINSYLNSMKSDEFCAASDYCSFNMQTNCAACVQRFQPLKDIAGRVVEQLTSYLSIICPKSSNMTDCLQFVANVRADIRSLIYEFDVQTTCQTMGFCEQNTAQHLDDYELAYIDVMKKQICPMLGPFQTLCQQIIQGDNIKMETISLSTTDIQDFFERCESDVDEVQAKTVEIVQSAQDKDKCQCCINRVIQKKKCMKRRVAIYVEHMKQLCKRCPAREKCERLWDEKKIRWDAKIDKICPRMVCTHMGYCNGTQLFGRIGERPKIMPFVDDSIQLRKKIIN